MKIKKIFNYSIFKLNKKKFQLVNKYEVSITLYIIRDDQE